MLTTLAAIVGILAIHEWRFHQQRRDIMSLRDDLTTELATINATTDDIASDIDDLVARVTDNSNQLTQADIDQLKATSDKLKGVGAKWPPQPPVEPTA